MAQSVFKGKKRKAKKVKGYNQGGMIAKPQGGGRGIMTINQKTVQAKGMGAATRGGNFKV